MNIFDLLNSYTPKIMSSIVQEILLSLFVCLFSLVCFTGLFSYEIEHKIPGFWPYVSGSFSNTLESGYSTGKGALDSVYEAVISNRSPRFQKPGSKAAKEKLFFDKEKQREATNVVWWSFLWTSIATAVLAGLLRNAFIAPIAMGITVCFGAAVALLFQLGWAFPDGVSSFVGIFVLTITLCFLLSRIVQSFAKSFG